MLVESIIFALCAIVGIQSVVVYIMHRSDKEGVKELIDTFNEERKEWQRERKDLLDRIQAPDFNQYAAKVIREKKAEQPEEPQEEIEFVS